MGMGMGGVQAALAATEVCQPLILAHSVAVYRAVRAALPGPAAAMVGHSLGEFSAAVCAGSLQLADAVRLVVRGAHPSTSASSFPLTRRLSSLDRHQCRRAQTMQAAATASGVPTKMVAVVLRPGTLDALVALVAAAAAANATTLDQTVSLANTNGPTQATLSGAAPAVDAVVNAAKDRRLVVRAVPLPVSAPFHSPFMAPATAAVRDALAHLAVAAPSVPIYSVAHARPVRCPAPPPRVVYPRLSALIRAGQIRASRTHRRSRRTTYGLRWWTKRSGRCGGTPRCQRASATWGARHGS